MFLLKLSIEIRSLFELNVWNVQLIYRHKLLLLQLLLPPIHLPLNYNNNPPNYPPTWCPHVSEEKLFKQVVTEFGNPLGLIRCFRQREETVGEE